MKKYIFFALFALVSAVVLFVFFVLNRPSQTLIVNTTPSITPVPTITPKPIDLFISSVLPPQNPKEPYLPIQKITVTFSEEVNPSSVRYELEPQTEILLRGGGDNKTIHIIPRTKWEIGTTKITILTSTTSVSGKALYRPYAYNLIVDIPPVPEGVFEIE